jgi:hypothetical protein
MACTPFACAKLAGTKGVFATSSGVNGVMYSCIASASTNIVLFLALPSGTFIRIYMSAPHCYPSPSVWCSIRRRVAMTIREIRRPLKHLQYDRGSDAGFRRDGKRQCDAYGMRQRIFYLSKHDVCTTSSIRS